MATATEAGFAHSRFKLMAAHHLQQITVDHPGIFADAQQTSGPTIEVLQPVPAIQHQKTLGGILQPIQQLLGAEPLADLLLALPWNHAPNQPKR